MEKKQKFVRATFTILEETDSMMREMARETGLKLSTIINQAVKAFFEKYSESKSEK